MADQERPDPKALLAAAQAEGRGRLKVFLGAAPGVGKTYAMLESAQAKRRDGVDVVAGVIETHGRLETAALLEDIEILPRKRVVYRERPMEEFDLDAAITRRPALLLVDELAHTNAPGSRHPKRYQDVEELLRTGIDVWTTLNIQHLESLNDVVAQITHVRVRETLPDSVLERADEIELVDLTPEDLLQRLKEGKVYSADLAERAGQNFFQAAKLTALRELALRRAAANVDEQMLGHMRRQAIPGPWPAGERILACISATPDPSHVVRAAARLATQLNARWMAVHFERPGIDPLDDADRTRVATALRLAEHLGGEARTVPATDLVEEILRFARNSNITQIVLGKTRRPSWRGWFQRSLVHELLAVSGAVAVHVVPDTDAGKPRMDLLVALRRQLAGAAGRGPRPYAEAALAVVVATLVSLGFKHGLDLDKTHALVLLCAVLLTAIRWGLWPSIACSLVAIVTFDVLFIPPYYSLTITNPEDLITLFVFLLVAVLVSNLAGRVREQAREARRGYRITSALFDFARNLAAVRSTDDLHWTIVNRIAAAIGGEAMLLLPLNGKLEIRAAFPPEDSLEASDWAAAHWAWDKGEPAGRETDTLPTAARLYLPLKTGVGRVGVLGIRAPRNGLSPDSRRSVEALADQATVAVERSNLEAEMREARIMSEGEKLRAALLSSISHDLGTPLSAIGGAVSTLRSTALPEEKRRALLDTIQEESDQLSRFVANLLDMTRIQSGALQPRKDWVDVRELVGSAVTRFRRSHGREVRVEITLPLPLLHADHILLEQVLFNLLDNAAKHGGPNIAIAASRDDGRLIIRVSDDGPGIPATDRERVFDKFYRVQRGERWADRQPAGTGLGLAVCRGIVEAHGGTIAATTPGTGKGTEITVLLPIEAQPAPPPP